MKALGTGKIITFYSYKGGVGRTLACANFGLYSARTGQKVVLMDMDFEAPGLDSKFKSVDVTTMRSGMLDQFSAFQKGAKSPPKLKAIKIPLPPDVSDTGARLHLLPAGDYTSSRYFDQLSALRWEVFSEKSGTAFCLN